MSGAPSPVSASSAAADSNAAPRQYRPAVQDRPGMARPVSATIASLQKGTAQRPSSEILSAHYKSPEAEAIDRWFEDLSYYEQTLEQMARAKLDDNFCEELKHIEQWFNVLSDPERTTALYSLLQNATPVQIRFFITVLQQMAQKDPLTGAVPPPEQIGKPPAIDAARLAQQTRVHSMPPRVSSPAVSPPIVLASPDEDDDRYLSVNPRSTRRLFDRHSAPNAEEQYGQYVGDGQHSGDQQSGYRRNADDNRHRSDRTNGADLSEDYAYKRGSYGSIRGPSPARASRNSAHMSPLLRPSTPIDDAIASADWSLNPPPVKVEPIHRPSSGLGNGTFSPVLGGLHDELSPAMASLTLQPPRSPYGNRPISPGAGRPVSPIILSPPTPTGDHPPVLGHPHSQWAYVDVGRSRTPNSHYTHSDYSDTYSHDGRGNDHGDGGYFDRNGMLGVHKEKGKIPESVDLEALNDIPSWLRSLRLHKYTSTFETMYWKDMIKMDENALIAKGVNALGARRKLLKVFELVRKDLDDKGVKY
ncbi:hypothetical protein HDU88_002955 [Geranomyces variabilis]|nr:hypothetical protein HDU88_002955 [Geranomyces variabilis]